MNEDLKPSSPGNKLVLFVWKVEVLLFKIQIDEKVVKYDDIWKSGDLHKYWKFEVSNQQFLTFEFDTIFWRHFVDLLF